MRDRVQRARASRAAPVDLARARLSRELRVPIRQLHALALEIGRRDLTEQELAQYCELTERIRRDAFTLRRTGNDE